MRKVEDSDLIFSAWLADAGVSVSTVWTTHKPDFIHRLAKEHKELRKDRENNPGVFDGAPDEANECTVYFARREGKISDAFRENKTYTRTLPKTKAREIAESKAREWSGVLSDGLIRELPDLIESAILEAQKDGEK